jgi:hypothetical protein
MDFRIYRDLSRDEVRKRVPPRYRTLVKRGSNGERTYTLLLYATDDEDVVVSRIVRQALTRLLPGDNEVIAVARNFTVEAIDLLAARGAEIVRSNGRYYADEDYNSMKHVLDRR